MLLDGRKEGWEGRETSRAFKVEVKWSEMEKSDLNAGQAKHAALGERHILLFQNMFLD